MPRRQVDFVVLEHLHQTLGLHVNLRQQRAGRDLGQAADDLGHHGHRTDLVDTDAKGALSACRVKTHQPANIVCKNAQHLFSWRRQLCREGGGQHAVARTHKQRIVEALAHAVELVTQGRLRRAELQRGARHRAVLQQGEDDAKVRKLDVPIEFVHDCNQIYDVFKPGVSL